MNTAASHLNPTQRLWLQLHARRAEQPWLLPAGMVALLTFVVLLASYVHVVNGQVLRGEKLRAAQRSMPAHPVDPFYPAYAATGAANEARVTPAVYNAVHVVPKGMAIATATPVAYALPSQ